MIIPQRTRMGTARNAAKRLNFRVVHAIYRCPSQAILYKRRIAKRTAASRTAARSPRKRLTTVPTRAPRPSRAAKPNHTMPKGLPGTAPPGPAMPLMATARSAPLRRSACAAISCTVGSLTAPYRASVAAFTPRSRCLASLEYTTQPARNQCEAPGGSVSARASPPPVQDSAVATVRPRVCRRRTSRCRAASGAAFAAATRRGAGRDRGGTKAAMIAAVSHGRATIRACRNTPR